MRLPYTDSTWGLWAILPHEGKTIDQVLGEVSTQGLKVPDTLTPLTLWLPRFQLTFRQNLKSQFALMGAAPAMDSGADFRPMIGHTDSLLDIIHESFMAVDEKGTTAAAATAFSVGRGLAHKQPILIFNRPFVILLTDEQTGAVLMLGIVADPKPVQESASPKTPSQKSPSP